MEFSFRKITLWGGFCERITDMIKHCIKKVVGKALINYGQIRTLLEEIERTLNSTPMTYLSDERSDEANTPSHLLYPRRAGLVQVSTLFYMYPCFLYWTCFSDVQGL